MRGGQGFFSGAVISRTGFRSLAMLLAAFLMLLVTPASGVAVGDPTIHGGGLNIVNFVSLEGEAMGYGWYVGFDATADFGEYGPSQDDVEVRVGGIALEYTDGFEVPFYNSDTGDVRVEVWGPYGEERLTEPFLGEYSVSIQDQYGVDAEFVIETLDDIPAGGPEVVAGVGQVGSTPTFSWLPFQSEYDGMLVDPWAYELNLGTPEGHWLFPIDASKTTVAFDDPDWLPEPPEPLAPGVYDVTLHSNHDVVTDPDGAGIINFEHHVSWQIVVSDDGFVTGGGWLEAEPPGAGTANFGFNVMVKKGAFQPTGNMVVVFAEGDLTFQATSFDSLVIDGATSHFQGTGTVNGQPGYSFSSYQVDGDPDQFGVGIWTWTEDGEVVDVFGTEGPLSGGSVVVHRK